MTVLIDTSVFLAYTFARDKNHLFAVQAVGKLNPMAVIVPAPVLSELFYMTTVRISYSHAVQLLSDIRQIFVIVPLLDADLDRMQEIMQQYQDARLDYTDTAIMALSERLNVQQIYTFDRRDFSIFRPKHCDYLELLP